MHTVSESLTGILISVEWFAAHLGLIVFPYLCLQAENTFTEFTATDHELDTNAVSCVAGHVLFVPCYPRKGAERISDTIRNSGTPWTYIYTI